ncbi:MAG: M1 family metallopeptidase [Anaerolineaceae bacterium]|nr:M1 family metallopeptidase [Anaerolineaceae bacterium]
MKKNKIAIGIFLSLTLTMLFISGCTPLVESLTVQSNTDTESKTTEDFLPTATVHEAEIVTDKEAFVARAENSSAGDPFMPEVGNLGYDVQNYAVQITLDPGTYWLESVVDIEMITTQDHLWQISLDMIGFQIDEVLVNQEEVDYFRLNKKLYVDLPQETNSGEKLNISIRYSGEPVQEMSAYVPFIDNLGIQFREDMLYIVSEPDGTRYWMPVNDHPLDKASYAMEITVPQPYTAVSNGQLLDTTIDGNQTTYYWENKEPLASALVTIAVGEYQRIESVSPQGIVLRSYVTMETAQDFQTLQPQIGEMIDWMSDLFGAYPFSEFGYVEVSDIGASLETQSMVIMSESAILDESVLCHEMAHMWFGDWVNLNSWSEIWRNEGFATYVSYMWENRENPAQLDDTMEFIAIGLQEDPHDFPLNNPPAEDMFGRDSYYKGALLVHQLRKQMGDDAFFSGLKTYFEQYGGSAASDADFQAIMEEAGGSSLDDFFTSWFE